MKMMMDGDIFVTNIGNEGCIYEPKQHAKNLGLDLG